MPVIAHRAIVGAGAAYLQNDIRALEVVEGPDGPVILAVGGANGGLVSLTLGAGGLALIADAAAYSSSMAAALEEDVMVLDTGGQQVAVIGHVIGQGLVGYVLDDDGSLGASMTIAIPEMEAGATGAFAVSASGFVYVATGAGAVGCFHPDSQGALQIGGTTYDSADSYLASPVDMVTANIDGRSFLLTLCDADDGVSAFAINGATGRLTESGAMGAQHGLGIFDVPVAMEVIEVSGHTFVIVASSADQGEGGALSVMELTAVGELRAIDHVLDTQGTRFGRVQDMEVIAYQGRTYVVVAGGDDGISLFTVLPDGRLVHLDTIENASGLGLSSISAMTAVLSGEAIEILLASHDQSGLTQFSVSLADQGATRQAANGRLSGSSRDDLLAGGGGSNTIWGGDGEDTLADGAGSDWLNGGTGTDVFLLEADGSSDVIADFEPGIDRIDLTLYPMLYSAAQVEIISVSWGAQMTIRGEVTEIRSADGGTLSEGEVLAALDWDTGRVPVVLADASSDTSGNDQIQGDGGNNVLSGDGGNDRIDGMAGADELDGGTGDDTLRGGDGDDSLRGGDGDDRLQGQNGNDHIDGAAGNDVLLGGAHRDILLGGAGNDQLEGRNGFDSLDGGSGNDTLIGGANADTLLGDDGADRLLGEWGHDVLEGGGGADFLNGGAENDTLRGGSNADTLEGGVNRDVLFGEDGDDYLNGQSGFDWLDGGLGNDTLIGEANADTMFGGAGNDVLDGGVGFDRLNGGEGHDLLRGGNNADTLNGDSGADTLIGEVGHDVLNGGAGFDHLIGGADNDTLRGGSNADTLEGGVNRDVLFGEDGDDYLNGQSGFDWLDGGLGNDTLIGEANADTMFGGAGNDVLDGGVGFDTLTGGAGADAFVFRAGGNADLITDFTPGVDQLQLDVAEDTFADLTMTSSSQGLRLGWTGGSVILAGVTEAAFDPSDVVFV